MNKDNPYQILDDILNSMNEVNYTHRTALYKNLQKINKNYDLKNSPSAIHKLIQENYLQYAETIENNKTLYLIDLYRLTYEGKLLINDGGYVYMKNLEKANTERTARYDKYVFVGAVLGGIYAFFEIVKDILILFFGYNF